MVKNALKSAPLLNALSAEEIKLIEEISIVRTYAKTHHIFLQEEPIQNVLFLFEGRVKIYRNDANGREQIVAIHTNGEMFPHVGFFREGGYPAFAQALEQCTLIIIPKKEFEKILIYNPDMSKKMFHVLGEKIVDLQKRLEAQILNNSYEQIIKLILRLGSDLGRKDSGGEIHVDLNITNQDLAKMIGSTRETISRTLSKLKKLGLLIETKEGYRYHPEKLMDELLL
ncbi:Crp/Fnr family transcriptional regulator [Bacillus sp. M6-12]|uniref:Crp/Fnr family transcriptional regulator n=1 Tax=Bacillus sp. M6-12 TaxID=2054166 RepID=UPI000C78197F|nr:Crp/Fnr family transcriptional regulator [Bacillus sp. M6-12]PLS16309.1 Crp/Fnr family transcriptional regulator [Bacillus sp. M6-12]